MIHWAAQSPPSDASARPLVAGDYACALGSQARDYPTSGQRRCARRLRSGWSSLAPQRRLEGIEIPANVEVKVNDSTAPGDERSAAQPFLDRALRGAEVPCGHVTIVSAMHCGWRRSFPPPRRDRLRRGRRHRSDVVPVGDVLAMARAIERLWQDSGGDPGSRRRGPDLRSQALRRGCRGRVLRELPAHPGAP